MMIPTCHTTHPATLLRFLLLRSTFRMTLSFREGTDRWFSGLVWPASSRVAAPSAAEEWSA